MKHTILLLTTALLLVSVALAEAPELKNMMPNSYQKLARLSDREERDFMENAAVTKAISAIDDYHLKQKPLSELHCQVFAETDCGLQFYRLLVSANPLEAAYTAEYKSKTADECQRMQRGTVFQIVFMRTKANALQNIGVFPYAHHWTSQGKDEGFTFNDLMIKPLNKDEIGFFVTEVSVGFVVDRASGMKTQWKSTTTSARTRLPHTTAPGSQNTALRKRNASQAKAKTALTFKPRSVFLIPTAH